MTITSEDQFSTVDTAAAEEFAERMFGVFDSSRCACW